ncbi:unnamed protein product [Schistocephalus solidus]|uniref:Homeobox protein B-H2 n=1 Tax=Schistocephalus solidus TaxID=70667 RepID=A0A183TH57_SCHSO|nr:unnamed protein product [Schistocephalus solidus]
MSTGSRSFQNQSYEPQPQQQPHQRFTGGGYGEVQEEDGNSPRSSSGGYGSSCNNYSTTPAHHHHQSHRPPPLPLGMSAYSPPSDTYRNYYHGNASMTAAAVAAAAYSYHYHHQQAQQEQAQQEASLLAREQAGIYEPANQPLGLPRSPMYSETGYGRNLSHPHSSRYLF